MGQKVNPIAFRLGYTKNWQAEWFAAKKYDYKNNLLEDHQIRSYIYKTMKAGNIANITLERTLQRIQIIIHTAKAGIIIGNKGSEIEKLKKTIKKFTNKEIRVKIAEINLPELEAKLMADAIAEQVKGRVSYKRVIKQTLALVTRAGAKGIKIRISGRLGGAEMARSEEYKEGRIPLHTLRADIDYALSEAQTVYGKIGVKVWIFKKEFPSREAFLAETLAKEEKYKKSKIYRPTKHYHGFRKKM